MFIDYRQSRAEALTSAERSIRRNEEFEAINIRLERGPGNILYDGVHARLAEARKERETILAISEEEWQRLHEEAIVQSRAYVARMNQGNDALWNNPHTNKEEVMRFLKGEE